VTAWSIELRNPSFSLCVLDRSHAILEGVQKTDGRLTVNACLRESLEDALRGQLIKVLGEFRSPGIRAAWRAFSLGSSSTVSLCTAFCAAWGLLVKAFRVVM